LLETLGTRHHEQTGQQQYEADQQRCRGEASTGQLTYERRGIDENRGNGECEDVDPRVSLVRFGDFGQRRS
jgi:hypothetical protein